MTGSSVSCLSCGSMADVECPPARPSYVSSRPPSPPLRSDSDGDGFSYPGSASSHVAALKGGRLDERRVRLTASTGMDWAPAASTAAAGGSVPSQSQSRSAPPSAASSSVTAPATAASQSRLSSADSNDTTASFSVTHPIVESPLSTDDTRMLARPHSASLYGRTQPFTAANPPNSSTGHGSSSTGAHVLSALSAALRRSKTPPPHMPHTQRPTGKATLAQLLSQHRSSHDSDSDHTLSNYDNTDRPTTRHSNLSSSAPNSPLHSSVPLLTVSGPPPSDPPEESSPLSAVDRTDTTTGTPAPRPLTVPSPPSPAPPPLFSPTFAHPAGVLLKEGLLQKQTPNGPRPVYLRLTSHPLTICEYDSESSSHPSAVHFPDSAWQFGHNPSSHSILLRSVLFTVVLLCKDSAEHREWRQALLMLQTEINENEEQRERETQEREKQRSAEEEARRLIAERKQRKLVRRRSAETPLSSSLPNDNSGGGVSSSVNGLSTPSSTLSIATSLSLSPSPLSPQNPLKSLSASARSSSDGSVSPATDRQPTWTEQQNEREMLMQPHQQMDSLSEMDDDERAAQLDNGPLMMRRASTRSMSLDESEMTQMRASRMGRLQSYGAEAAAGGTPPATAMSTTALATVTGGEHRKLTDPLPSSQLSATPSSYPSAVQQREKREEEERAKRAEEKAAAYLRLQKSKAYIKLFSLPESEELICDYSCAVQRAILLHGRMYVSEHFVCFFSSIFSHKTSLVLPMDDVLFVASAKVALVFDNSLKVHQQHHTGTRTHTRARLDEEKLGLTRHARSVKT